MLPPSPMGSETIISGVTRRAGRGSVGASLNDPPPAQTTTIGPQFTGDLSSVVTLLNNNSHTVSVVLSFSSARALQVALSRLILPLRQPIRPFATYKALSGPT